MQPKPVPNEQCERERFFKTGYSKPIQPNQFEHGFSVNTLIVVWLRLESIVPFGNCPHRSGEEQFEILSVNLSKVS